MSSSSIGYTVPGPPDKLLQGTGKPKNDWVIAWHAWFLGIGTNDNPSYGVPGYGDRSVDYNQGRYPPQFQDEKGKVYFLAGAAGTKFTTRSIIPYDTWQCILVPVYLMSGSLKEFPGLDELGLQKLVDDDFAGAKLGDKDSINATIDGQDLTGSIEQVKIYTPFSVSLPDDNILRIGDLSIEMITNGYWLFLDPESLGPGEHILYVLGKSKTYVTETTYNLTIRGKKK
jgi:hypothetical protein